MTPHPTVPDVVEEEIKAILEHESIKAADSAITLQAVRSGTSGYVGETLDVPLRAAFTRIYTLGLSDGERKKEAEIREIIGKHNARILNQFQLQGKPDMPMIAYDERVCLAPAMTVATEETLAALTPTLPPNNESK